MRFRIVKTHTQNNILKNVTKFNFVDVENGNGNKTFRKTSFAKCNNLLFYFFYYYFQRINFFHSYKLTQNTI